MKKGCVHLITRSDYRKWGVEGDLLGPVMLACGAKSYLTEEDCVLSVKGFKYHSNTQCPACALILLTNPELFIDYSGV